MTDPQPPRGNGDQRDERVASLLAVEPLDDLTRRRLVDTAVRAASRRPWARYAAAAAAVLALAGGGLALLVGPSGDHGTAPHAAAPRPGTAPAPNGSGSPQPSAAALLPVTLGDFGNLDDAANVARLRARAAAATTGSGVGGLPARSPSIDAARACATPVEPITAVATGTVGGHPAVVLVSGLRLTVVVLNPCEVHPLP